MGQIEKAEIAARRPAREPTHPRAILREDVLPAIGESVANAAKKLGVTRQHTCTALSPRRRRSAPRWRSASASFAATVRSYGCGCSRPATCGTRNALCGRRSRRFRPRRRGRREH
jgi:hypothetical protein